VKISHRGISSSPPPLLSSFSFARAGPRLPVAQTAWGHTPQGGVATQRSLRRRGLENGEWRKGGREVTKLCGVAVLDAATSCNVVLSLPPLLLLLRPPLTADGWETPVLSRLDGGGGGAGQKLSGGEWNVSRRGETNESPCPGQDKCDVASAAQHSLSSPPSSSSSHVGVCADALATYEQRRSCSGAKA
jgi:hypothetical protein